MAPKLRRLLMTCKSDNKGISLSYNKLSRVRPEFWDIRSYAAQSYRSDSDNADFEAARQWFARFNDSTIPERIAKTTFSRASGAGGQKVNKTSSKATTVWPMKLLDEHIPKVLRLRLRESRYYVLSSDSLSIQCDSQRSQPQNEALNHAKLAEEVRQIYRATVPGVTSLEQKKRVEQLIKSDNEIRVKDKKHHGEKKRARSSSGRDY